jgi:hypothetical protein
MAGFNNATLFSPKVSKVLKDKTVIGGLTNRDYKWTGVDTVKIYTRTTFATVDYDRNGGSERYGNGNNATTSIQTWTVEQDSAFNIIVDRLDNDQQMGVLKPGELLADQLKEQIVPEVDAYVLAAMVTAGAAASRDDIVTDAAVTASNAWVDFLAIRADIMANEGGSEGFAAVMLPKYYNFLKQSGLVLDSDKGQTKLESGDLGLVDGVRVRTAPASRLGTDVNMIITHPSVTTFADVLTDYTTHKNPPGISGWKIEGRVAYDAFVDTNKVNRLGIHKSA